MCRHFGLLLLLLWPLLLLLSLTVQAFGPFHFRKPLFKLVLCGLLGRRFRFGLFWRLRLDGWRQLCSCHFGRRGDRWPVLVDRTLEMCRVFFLSEAILFPF